MLTIHVWPKWLKEFLLTHPLYKSPEESTFCTFSAQQHDTYTLQKARRIWNHGAMCALKYAMAP